MKIKVRTIQMKIENDLNDNKQKVIQYIRDSKADEWIIFPEGTLSGYFPEDQDFLSKLDVNLINNSIDEVKSIIEKQNIHCIFGTVLKINNSWFNCSIYIDSEQAYMYQKANLSVSDKHHFLPGNELSVFESKEGVKFGIQNSRDLIFPEQWKVLKHKGAQVVFHLNNAIKPRDDVKKHLLIARAFENQYFVCSANNASKPQVLQSYIINPNGEIIYDSVAQKEGSSLKEINLDLAENSYLQEERIGLVKLDYK